MKIQDASKDLVTSLNPFLISQISKVEDNALLSIQNAIMATPHTGTFRPVHYEIVMKHLGMGKHLVGTNDTAIVDQASTTEWARRLLHHCDAIGNLKNTFLFSELCEGKKETKAFDTLDAYVCLLDISKSEIVHLMNNHETVLYYWAMWESARYCILSRLRTPFGNPQQV